MLVIDCVVCGVEVPIVKACDWHVPTELVRVPILVVEDRQVFDAQIGRKSRIAEYKLVETFSLVNKEHRGVVAAHEQTSNKRVEN